MESVSLDGQGTLCLVSHILTIPHIWTCIIFLDVASMPRCQYRKKAPFVVSQIPVSQAILGVPAFAGDYPRFPEFSQAVFAFTLRANLHTVAYVRIFETDLSFGGGCGVSFPWCISLFPNRSRGGFSCCVYNGALLLEESKR